MNFLKVFFGNTIATPVFRDATAPLPGALQNAGSTAIIVWAASQAAGVACQGYLPTSTLAPFCAQMGGQAATVLMSLLIGAATGTYTFVTKKIKDANAVTLPLVPAAKP